MGRFLAIWILVGVFAALFLGCSAPRLYDERQTEPYATLLRRGEAHGTRVIDVNGARPDDPPLRMRLHAMPAQPHDRGPLIVLQPGVLTDSGSWRFVAPALADDYDVLAIDPPGCGGSDAPGVAELPADAYSPTWIGRHTLRAIAEWEKSEGLRPRRIVWVGHSIGGAAILMALGDKATRAELPDMVRRVDRIVLFQPADVGMKNVDPRFQVFVDVQGGAVQTAHALGLLSMGVRDGVVDSVHQPSRRALQQEAERMHCLMIDDARRRAAQAMLLRFRPVDDCGEPIPAATRELVSRYGRVTNPTLIVWGEEDETFSLEDGRRISLLLPNARLHVFTDTKHSVHQERPLDSAALIREMVEMGPYAPWGLRARPASPSPSSAASSPRRDR